MSASRALSLALAGWCALCAALLTASCLSSASPGWTRGYTFTEVLKRSTKTKRFILLKVVSDYCPPCRELDETLSEDKVRAELVDEPLEAAGAAAHAVEPCLGHAAG